MKPFPRGALRDWGSVSCPVMWDSDRDAVSIPSLVFPVASQFKPFFPQG